MNYSWFFRRGCAAGAMVLVRTTPGETGKQWNSVMCSHYLLWPALQHSHSMWNGVLSSVGKVCTYPLFVCQVYDHMFTNYVNQFTLFYCMFQLTYRSILYNHPWLSGLGRGTPWPCLKLRCVGGREFNPLPGQYSSMSLSSDQVTGTVLSSEHAFPAKFWIYLEHCPRGKP